jgi:ribonuclease VapC
MIVDTSPLVAILTKEPGFERYVDAISHAPRCRMSAGNFLELSIVIEGQFGADVLRQCDALIRRIGMVIEPVTVDQAHAARQAFHDFGKGRHPAALNLAIVSPTRWRRSQESLFCSRARISERPILYPHSDGRPFETIRQTRQ